METNNNIFNKFSKHLKTVLVRAQDLAFSINKKEINVWEILYALAIERGSVAFGLFSNKGIKPVDFKEQAIKEAKPQKEKSLTKNFNVPQFSLKSQKIIEKAVKIAYQNKHAYIGSEHLLSAVLKSNIKEVDNFLKEKKIDKNELIKEVDALLLNTSKLSDLIDDTLSNVNVLEKMIMGGNMMETGPVPQFTMELTSAEIQKKIDPVIGRQKEIDRLIQILSRRTKNNPILLGESGVGKTAIVEGLAKRIVEGDVPDVLLEKKIISLDLGSVIAGTIYRGEFEKRLKKIIDDAKKDENIILFIDEIHTLIGMGATSGQLDAANLLKPELAKGDLKVIGATTVQEYKKYVESDVAFERRFQSIVIDESTASETKEIIHGLRDNYEKYHAVKITDEAIKAAVDLSQRYLPEKFLPDKAIDLIDEAASKFKVKKLKNGSLKKIIQLKGDLKNTSEEKEVAIDKDDYEKAIFYKENEDKIIKELNKLNQEKLNKVKFLGQINAKDIAEVVSHMINIPMDELMKSEKKKLIRLEKNLSKNLIGQSEIIKDVSEYIRRAKAGLANPNKPLASFMFLGPSGVGKTETAKVLAREVYNNEKALIKIDMSEFSEKFNSSKLIGAPAGYIGYKDSNKFTDQVRMKPYSIVLFDEIEKAHPDVFNLLLPVLEEGYITDATGKTINFKNTIIIMTSNIGNEQFNKHASIGFNVPSKTKKEIIDEEYEGLENKVRNSLSDYFRPEFLNRLDKILVFRPLDVKNISKIAKLQMQELEQRLKDKKIDLKIENKIYQNIALNSFEPEMGARPVRRYIQDKIENLIANKILADKIHNGDTVKIFLKNKQIEVEKV